ncbi:MAG: type II toxin-antitoxin system HipA family toxin [Sphaerochaetaceae bacterium]|jgi:serine/threonine-protein kinase HipA
MKRTNLLSLYYQDILVGRLALTKESLCAFEYDLNWLQNGFSISPFKLPLEKRVFIANRDPFNGNFGVFEDSLPDGWGRLLIDRLLIKNQIKPAELSILDRLAIVGKTGMGALEYRPETNLTSEEVKLNLESLAAECEKILIGDYSASIEELVKAGGSSGGARPKVLIKHNSEDWIVKFRSSLDPVDIGKQEYETSIKAKKAGLDMPQTKLFENKYFGVKRFDRKEGGAKVHMLSASGLLDASHRYPTLDYVDLLKATLLLTRDYRELEKMFRLMCFNVFSHNRDDHAKNFSFLYIDNRWRVSPPYDLVRSDGPGGEHTTAVGGEGRNPTEKDILKVAKETGIKKSKAQQIIDEVKSVF